ncbi:Regulator of nucleoside diphosphate kinase [Rubripirellula amarantea]|uniref:Regulator of nucleoside diphosphate kinase n=1 Tax=Rubripirellula amarantea TaxID=2527999 RepID=A0A5C5WAT8_9BACT|nr:nucleoside diphosphate kinase regulator [Rubripirellula amarantea]TWT48026.1 Regulator of nucleoside diphosphate kinase [Rubripirellula amarantea]
MTKKKTITVTSEDRERLERLFVSSLAAAFLDKPYLNDLRQELEQANVVGRGEVPADVVTMNSTVVIKDMKSKETETFTLVYPDEANIADGRLSILAPLGIAILGYRVGDTIRWKIPNGEGRWRVERIVYQPEREGIPA